jgi:hypothetical protein
MTGVARDTHGEEGNKNPEPCRGRECDAGGDSDQSLPEARSSDIL